MLQVQDVILSLDIITEEFCCDISRCHGACCIEGDAGAPITIEEISAIEDLLPVIWDDLTEEAKDLIEKEGITYPDPEGQMVTQIINGKDCVFSYRSEDGNTCMCAIERAFRNGLCHFMKPISCHLYPIREKIIGPYVGLEYNRWDICCHAIGKGHKEGTRLYQFLKEPLIRRFGKEWYDELEITVREMLKQNLI